MTPSIFAEKEFFRILSVTNGYGHVFLDRIRDRNWYGLVYDNSEFDAYYCPELVKKFYHALTLPLYWSWPSPIYCALWHWGHHGYNWHDWGLHTSPQFTTTQRTPSPYWVHDNHRCSVYGVWLWAQDKHNFSQCPLCWKMDPMQYISPWPHYIFR